MKLNENSIEFSLSTWTWRVIKLSRLSCYTGSIWCNFPTFFILNYVNVTKALSYFIVDSSRFLKLLLFRICCIPPILLVSVDVYK